MKNEFTHPKLGKEIWGIWPDQRRRDGFVILPGVVTSVQQIFVDADSSETIEVEDLQDFDEKKIAVKTTYTINYTASTQQVFDSEEALLKSELYKNIEKLKKRIRKIEWQDI